MKIVFQRVVSDEGSSFVFLDKRARRFRGRCHFHPEYEITMITAGHGIRVVGDNVSAYASGDLALIGSNVPHQYVSDADAPPGARAYVLQFSPQFLGNALVDVPEMAPIARLLERSRGGYVFGADTARQAAPIFRSLRRQEALPRLLSLLELLRLLERSSERRPICTAAYAATVDTRESQQINRALTFIHQNFDSPITLAQVAELMKVSRATCNRLFGKSVGRSFKSFLVNVRISHACQLLLETDKNIIDIAGRCGFGNLSNFNRQFKALKAQTPRQFRKKSRPG